jgi:hypothetical protein
LKLENDFSLYLSIRPFVNRLWSLNFSSDWQICLTDQRFLEMIVNLTRSKAETNIINRTKKRNKFQFSNQFSNGTYLSVAVLTSFRVLHTFGSRDGLDCRVVQEEVPIFVEAFVEASLTAKPCCRVQRHFIRIDLDNGNR